VVAFPDLFNVSTVPGAVCRSAFTTNEGGSWSLGGATPLQQRPGATNVQCIDPSIAADFQGNFYLAYLNVNSPLNQFPFDVFVAKSTDGGATFPTYAVAVPGVSGVNDADKPYIGADNQPASPFRGSLYVSWTDFGSKQTIKAVFSRDGGLTWSAPAAVSHPTKVNQNITGSLPVVAPDGTVYVFWMLAVTSSSNDLSILFSKSQNGGVTWGPQSTVAAHLPSPGFINLKNADPAYGTDPFSGLRIISNPSAAIAPDGTIYVAWTDFPQGTCTQLSQFGDWACSNADVRLSVSRNGGRGWTAPVKISDDGAGGTDQFFPWIATHPDGLLSLAWIDRRLDPNNVDCNTFYTNTSDGVTFLPNVRASSVTSTVGTGEFIGDYIGLAATANAAFPVWGDLRFSSTAPTDFTAKGTLQP
jgi:hypothetical protein